MDLSGKIKAVRAERKIKQIRVAEAIGLDAAYYARLENQKAGSIKFDQLEGISEALGFKSVVELLTYGEEREVRDSPEQAGEVRKLRERVQELEDRIADKQALLKKIQAKEQAYEFAISTSIDQSVVSIIGSLDKRATRQTALKALLLEEFFSHFAFYAWAQGATENQDINKLFPKEDVDFLKLREAITQMQEKETEQPDPETDGR